MGYLIFIILKFISSQRNKLLLKILIYLLLANLAVCLVSRRLRLLLLYILLVWCNELHILYWLLLWILRSLLNAWISSILRYVFILKTHATSHRLWIIIKEIYISLLLQPGNPRKVLRACPKNIKWWIIFFLYLFSNKRKVLLRYKCLIILVLVVFVIVESWWGLYYKLWLQYLFLSVRYVIVWFLTIVYCRCSCWSGRLVTLLSP